VWTNGLASWVPAQQVPELGALFGPPPLSGSSSPPGPPPLPGG